MLENHTLKQQNDQLRRELAHMSYKCEAAVRTCCNLLQDKEQLIQQIEDNKSKWEEEKQFFIAQAEAAQ